ncbi:hypothetical protein Psi02_64220 [Planotetraspora silvatica]|uniref:Uncharacterized protein n=1 Tax=Planotetraspora silvatica TaxID=234614 RepID=A0A8J3XUY7_9ACTN|nr:hypothetical protein Psi02_64220 [Planotetraspora silvatica]
MGGYIVVSLCRLSGIRLPTRDDHRRVLIAALAAFLLALYLLYELSTDFAPQPHLLRAGVVCIVSALASIVLAVLRAVGVARFPQPQAGPASPPRNWREVWLSSGATVVAALIALPLTWYSTQYVPDAAAPTITITSSLKAGQAAVSAPIPITMTITFKNTATASVRVLGSMYQLTGTATSVSPTRSVAIDTSQRDAALKENYGPAARYNRYATHQQAQVIQYGQVVEDAVELIPNEESTATIVAFVPPSVLSGDKGFSLLRLTVDIVFVRADRVSLGVPDAVDSTSTASGSERDHEGCEGRQVLQRRWTVTYGSLIDRLTQSRREVAIGRTVQSSATGLPEPDLWWEAIPSLDYSIHHGQQPCGRLVNPDQYGSDRGLEERSMLSTAGAVTELAAPRPIPPSTTKP